MIFNHFVTFASQHNLAIQTNFTANRHSVVPEEVSQYFFGDGTMTPLPNNTTCLRKETIRENLPDEVLKAREEGSCVVFVVKISAFPPDENGMKDNLPYYRKMFEENNVGRKSVLMTRDGNHVMLIPMLLV
jgi:hypothetical protein